MNNAVDRKDGYQNYRSDAEISKHFAIIYGKYFLGQPIDKNTRILKH